MVWLRRALFVVAIVGTALLVWSVWDHDAWLAWMQRARPLPFFTAMTVVSVLGVPVTPLFVLAGVTFGARVGLVGSLLAVAASLASCYWIARALRGPMKRLLRRFGWELPNLAEREKGAIRFTLAVKLAPGLPHFVKTYALGVAGVPFGTYFAISMLVTGTYAAALVVLGKSMFDHRSGTLWIAAAVIVVGLGLWWWLRRRQQRPKAWGGSPGAGVDTRNRSPA
jgi:uncharacterized membrane protein YdjX (TVP38/TMEM64 family)